MQQPKQCVENIVPGMELPNFQNIGVQELLLNKKMLLAFDTGTGKTFTYSVFVRGLLNRNPEKKHIFVIIHDSLEQCPADIQAIACVPTAAFSGVATELNRLQKMWERLSVIVLTYESFRNMDLVRWIYAHLPEVESFVIDEAHHVANWDESNTAFMLRSLCRMIPYVAALTATPITSEAKQYYRLINLIDRDISHQRKEVSQEAYATRYLPVNREDYDIKGNYKTTLEVVIPTKEQLGSIRGIISRVLKGTGAQPQVERLLSVIKDRLSRGLSVIVYVNYHDTRSWVEYNLALEGLKFVSLHGKIVKAEARREILRKFSEGEVPILITSVSESLNIDSDVVVFYEFTTKIKQVMGRAHRGLEGKELELVFIITRDTMEVDYFLKYIYARSLVIQRLLHKDYAEFIKIGEQLKFMEDSDD